jgi:hypothetical protein
MNERIKELIKQATNPDYDGDDGPMNELNIEKFAELLIQDCIDEIKTLRGKYDTHRDVEPEGNDWYIDAFLQAEVRLKEHFGVEQE